MSTTTIKSRASFGTAYIGSNNTRRTKGKYSAPTGLGRRVNAFTAVGLVGVAPTVPFLHTGLAGLPDIATFTQYSLYVQKEVHPDFGPLFMVRKTRAYDIEGFRFTRTLKVKIYENSDGYTAISSDLPNVIGYGDSHSQAYYGWLMHLATLRANYGSSKDSELTKRAIRLRDNLNGLLRPTGE